MTRVPGCEAFRFHGKDEDEERKKLREELNHDYELFTHLLSKRRGSGAKTIAFRKLSREEVLTLKMS
jgi:hypothetical protein